MTIEYRSDYNNSYAKISFCDDEYEQYVDVEDELSAAGWDTSSVIVASDYMYSLIIVSNYDEYLDVKEDFDDITKQ